MRQDWQCWYCRFRLFFKPVPGETFSCCSEHKETVESINFEIGVSPVIQRHGIEGVVCGKFKVGRSVCETNDDQPFELHPVRVTGEKFILKRCFPRWL